MAKKKAREAGADVKESARRIWLAGLGALAVAEEEGSKVFKSLLKKGEGYEADNKARTAKLRKDFEELKGKAGKTVDRLGSELDSQVTKVLHRIGVPTRDEIRTLTRKVEQLTANVEKLKAPRRKTERTKPVKAAAETATEA